MQPADGRKFRELLRAMNRVLATQTGAELDQPMLDVYWLALRDWPLGEFEQACAHLVKTSQFMPKPADFTALRKAANLSAGEAWELVREAARQGDNTTGDERADAAARVLGGFRAIGMTNSDQMHFLERRFCEHYDEICSREDTREALPKIAGEPRFDTPKLQGRALPYDPRKRLA